MTDVFVLDFDADNDLRDKMAEVCVVRWCMETCNLHAMGSSDKNFHIMGKSIAERRANSDIYVVADNDCLILGENFVARGIRIMEMHPEYGLLAAANICEGEFSSGTEWHRADEAEERSVVGGVAFVRKGILKDFTPCTPQKVDTVICDGFRAKGYKTGIMPSVRFNHIGAGYSLSNPNWWNKVPD